MSINRPELPKPAKSPCKTCPYRKDVPSGIWDETEYQKLPLYDGQTFEQQTTSLFFCHQQDGHLCAGWAGCHDPQELLALRLHEVDPATYDYRSPTPLFASGAEAAAHGMANINDPDVKARNAISRLQRKRENAKVST
jgi:Family of unknown function (DUF6283)